ncbi:hypothetical protein [Bacillus manliponensis]|uniref:hypothetical protein n=1 Tax=Bacillus manliponensis TaxID=574376 RepID=UPI0035141EB2
MMQNVEFVNEYFKEWKVMFKDFEKVGSTRKGFGIAGSTLSIGTNVVTAQKDGWQLHDAVDITTDSVIDIGATAGAAATGAVAGSFFLPPVGTVVGAGVGIVTSLALNTKMSIIGDESVVSYTKNAVKGVTKKISSLFW